VRENEERLREGVMGSLRAREKSTRLDLEGEKARRQSDAHEAKELRDAWIDLKRDGRGRWSEDGEEARLYHRQREG
jgi:hypothetical protein